MRRISFSEAARANLEARGVNYETDLHNLRTGQLTVTALRYKYLVGAELTTIAGWLEYIDALDAAVRLERAHRSRPGYST